MSAPLAGAACLLMLCRVRTGGLARRQVGAVFCGGGPAATGVIVCAAAEHKFAELLSRGVAIIERSEHTGAGSIGHYPITANTRGLTFLRSLEQVEPRQAFESVLADHATQVLDRMRNVFPSLPVVGRHLEGIGRVVESALAAHERCSVNTRYVVREVQLLRGGGVTVGAEDAAGIRSSIEITAQFAVLAMGGTPRTGLDELEVLPGLTLRPYSDKLCHAAVVLDDRAGLPADLRQMVARARSVAIVGGSHSAWSAAWLLIRDPALRDRQGRPPSVTVLHRSPLRFFFWSEAKARSAGYEFDPALDVCPSTRTVNRHGGLRADAHALAWSAIRGGHRTSPVRAIRLADDPDGRRAAARVLDEAGAIVAAVGYDANLPDIRAADGSPLTLSRSAKGLVVTPSAHPVAADGPVPELMAYGLGAGLPASGALAGEASYRGPVDAVRLYQAEVGRIVLDSLLVGSS